MNLDLRLTLRFAKNITKVQFAQNLKNWSDIYEHNHLNQFWLVVSHKIERQWQSLNSV